MGTLDDDGPGADEGTVLDDHRCGPWWLEDASDADDTGGPHAPALVAGTHDRRPVYAALAEIAHALEVIEPHSPVPYLIRRAVAWGGLNTAQLYNEVFVRCGGQINIFELLGLGDPVAGQERTAAG